MTDVVGSGNRAGAAAIPPTHSARRMAQPRSEASQRQTPTLRWKWTPITAVGIGAYDHSTYLLLIAFLAFGHLVIGQGVAATVRCTLLMLAMFTTVVLHKFAHVLAAWLFGVRTRERTLATQQHLVAVTGPRIRGAKNVVHQTESARGEVAVGSQYDGSCENLRGGDRSWRGGCR